MKLRASDGMVGRFSVLGSALTAAGLLMNTTTEAAPAFDRLVVFGDSLSDTGNAGRFSNGPVWVEQLATRLNLELRPSQAGGSNFAVGGARLDPRSGPHNLRAQADLFLRMLRPTARTLYIVYGGGNDLLAAVGAPHALFMVDTAVASLKSIVADLVGQGATDILVPNLPDIGMTPEMQARGSRAVLEAGRLTSYFNAAVDGALAEWAGTPKVRLHRLDVRAMAERAKRDPAAFDFVDITTPCIRLPACKGYLFWDHVHPTTRAHAHLAEAAIRVVFSQ
jgi:phospholipase/lecithinase/hemolysin